MATVKYAEAKKEQLLVLATEQLGLEVPKNITVEQLRAKIAEAGFTAETFELEDAPEEKPQAPTRAQIENFDDERMVLISIPQQEGVPGGDEAVCVGVNGVVARIMRGVEVKVPMKYVRVLQNALKGVPVVDENKQIVGFREVPIYPFSILQAL